MRRVIKPPNRRHWKTATDIQNNSDDNNNNNDTRIRGYIHATRQTVPPYRQ